jgi:hypothetical protein
MALIKINDEYKIFSNNKNMLTLTDEDYELCPDAKEYIICITETRMIINYQNIISFHERLEGLIITVKLYPTQLYITTKITHVLISDHRLHVLKKYIHIGDIGYTDGNALSGKTFCAVGDNIYTHIRADHKVYKLVSEKMNSLITHLYHEGKFLGSAFRNNAGDLIIGDNKIIKSTKIHGHLLAQYENGETHLILLYYSYFYSVPCDIAFPGTMTKSARGYVEI